MANFPVFHGITLAANSYIENLHVEILAADPMPVAAGRIWYNSTDKKFRQSTLDGTGAVIVRTFATEEELQLALNGLDTRLEAVETNYIKKDGSVAFTGTVDAGGQLVSNVATPVADTDAATKGYVDAEVAKLGNAFNYVGVVDGGTDVAPTDLSALPEVGKDAGDYYKVGVAGYFTVDGSTILFANVGDGLVFNLAGGVDVIDNTNSSVAGTANEIAVTGSADTGFVVAIDAAFSGRVTTLETEAANAQAAVGLDSEGNFVAYSGTNYLDATSTIVGAIAALDAAVKAEETRAIGVEGLLADLTTDAKTTLVSAINEVNANADQAQAEVDALETLVGPLSALATTDQTSIVDAINEVVTLVGGGTADVRNDYNATIFTFDSKTANGGVAATTYTIDHNLANAFTDVSVFVERSAGSGVYFNDIVSVEQVSANQVKVYLSTALHVKVVVRSAAAI